jgi:hypothetical protein
MFKMYIQTRVSPVYQPPAPQIKIKPLANRNLGTIFSPLVSNGPCTSCGNSK